MSKSRGIFARVSFYPSNNWPASAWVRSIALPILLLSFASATQALTADQIVERADRVRFPNTGFQVNVAIRTGKGNYKYRVLAKGISRSIVQTLAPASEKGQVMLMRGANFWVFLPNVSQPVRLPLSQRLTGQVANGDLARANFAGDYNAKLLGEVTVGGKKMYHLELTAAKSHVTYHRVLYWVEVGNYRPYKAEFYSRSNRLLKTGLYKRYAELGGAMRPTQLVLEDGLKRNERSVLTYSSMQGRKLPDKVFTKTFLKKLK